MHGLPPMTSGLKVIRSRVFILTSTLIQ
jgi:hypothetical protein